MTHVTCGLTAENRDQLQNPTLGNREWATFTCLPLPSSHRATQRHATRHFVASVWRREMCTGDESVPKIIINNTMNLLFKIAISILVISNHNSYRVLFDKIARVYFI